MTDRVLARRQLLATAGAALAGFWGATGCRRGGAQRDAGRAGVPTTTLEPASGFGAQPLPANLPIDRVVVIVKENRTYDALFGGFPEGEPDLFGRGTPACAAAMDDEDVPHGRAVALRPETHLRCHHTAESAAVYHALAREYALCARFFSEVRGPSFPNHLMLIAGQVPAHDDPLEPPERWRCPRHCFDYPTIADQMAAAGRTWRSYNETGFVSSFWMIRHLERSPNIVPWQQFESDARAGTLPNLSFVFSEKVDSEHPPESLCRGQDWTLRQLRAVAEGPQWPRTAVFVVWDDWGGFHDHVTPPVIERDANHQPLRYGHRVPCLVVSPYARRRYLSVARHSHLSLMRFAEAVFGLPPLNARVAASSAMADCFDFTQPVQPAVLPGEMPCPA